MKLPLKPFYFIRHGETELNRQGIIIGSIDISLNAHGMEQARHAALSLKNEKFDIIISSPRKRALQTAEVISYAIPKSIILENDLVERVWGAAEGQPFDSTKSLFDDDNTPDGAELFTIFSQRIISTVSKHLLNEQNLPLFVSHGGVFKALVHYLGYEKLNSSNGTPFLFSPPELGGTKWKIHNLKDNKSKNLA